MGIPATPKKVGVLNHNPQPVLSFPIQSYRPLRFTGNPLIYCMATILCKQLLNPLTSSRVIYPLNFLKYSYPICRK